MKQSMVAHEKVTASNGLFLPRSSQSNTPCSSSTGACSCLWCVQKISSANMPRFRYHQMNQTSRMSIQKSVAQLFKKEISSTNVPCFPVLDELRQQNVHSEICCSSTVNSQTGISTNHFNDPYAQEIYSTPTSLFLGVPASMGTLLI